MRYLHVNHALPSELRITGTGRLCSLVSKMSRVAIALCLSTSVIAFAPASASVAYAAGASYYVSTTGSDSNVGTQAAPFKTIQKAANTAGAGDTVYVGPGTYNERVTVSKSGTSAAPIVFTAQSARPKISRGISITGSYVRFSEFTPWPMAASDGAGTSAVQLSGDYNVVSGFDFPAGGLGGSAVAFKSGASYNTVSDFQVTDIPWCGAEFNPNSNNNLLKNGYVHGYGDNVCIGNHDGTANVIDGVEITGEGYAHDAGGWQSSSSDGDGVKIRGKNNVIRNSRIHHIFQANPNSHTDVFQIDAVAATGYLIDSCTIGSYATARPTAPVPGNGDCPNQYLMLETGGGNSSVTVQNSTFLGDGGAYFVANLNPSGYSDGATPSL